MKKGLFGLFAVVLLFTGTAIAGPVEVSGGLDITGTPEVDGITFPDNTTQTTAVNGSQYQKRVTGSCSSGYAISSIDSTGGVVGCQPMGSGTVTSVDTGTGLTGGPITGSGSISLTNTTVTPGSYTSANITVDSQGRVTNASNGISNFVDLSSAQTIGGAKTFSNDVTMSGDLILPSYGRIYFGTSQVLAYPGANNFFVGMGAGNLATTGDSNTALGTISLQSNTTGDTNTALGYGALNANLTGSDNTATGNVALMSNTTGSNNTAVGSNALHSSSTASRNTAIGDSALYTQSYDPGAGPWNSDNTAVGYKALYSNQPTSVGNGGWNTAVGSLALQSNTTGYENTADGYYALFGNTTGFNNTASGTLALHSNTAGYNNTAIGVNAMGNNTTGNENTASGVAALFGNTTASRNTAVGRYALYAQSYDNGGVAWLSDNTAVGYGALYSNQPTATNNGIYNSALGFLALFLNTTGHSNSALGSGALYSNATGSSNTASGRDSLYNNTIGAFNTAIGFDAGYNQTTGSNNTYLGANVFGVAGEDNVIRIGNGAAAAYISGINGATSSGGVAVYVNGSGQLGTSTSSRRFKEDIQDMGDATDNLMKLRPVTFYYKPEYANGPRLLQYGLIAEEVEEIYPGLVQYDDKGQPNTVYYQFVNAMLLNEVQKQHRAIEGQQEQIETLKEQLNNQKKSFEERLSHLEALVHRNYDE